jgi:hypothetical protein
MRRDWTHRETARQSESSSSRAYRSGGISATEIQRVRTARIIEAILVAIAV